MNPFFLDEQQRKFLLEKSPTEFKDILHHYKLDLLANTQLQWSAEDWQSAFRWAGDNWYNKSQQMSLTEAWQKVSEEFHRSFKPGFRAQTQSAQSSNGTPINPVKHPEFLEDAENLQIESTTRANKVTRMMLQVFIGLVVWKILIIVIFQKSCVAQ